MVHNSFSMLSLVKGVTNKILRTVSVPVTKFDKKLLKTLEEMYVRMEDWSGIGLAAPQVGINERFFVMKLFKGNTDEFTLVPVINPEITHISEKMVHEEEGCLSIPSKYGIVPRHDALTVKFQNPKKEWVTLKLKGLNARIIQHETDHLNATLIADKVTEWTREKGKK